MTKSLIFYSKILWTWDGAAIIHISTSLKSAGLEEIVCKLPSKSPFDSQADPLVVPLTVYAHFSGYLVKIETLCPFDY